MKKKTLGLIAGICSLGMMLSLSACGSNATFSPAAIRRVFVCI